MHEAASRVVMSALGQKQACAVHFGDVRFVPIADMSYSITLVGVGQQRLEEGEVERWR